MKCVFEQIEPGLVRCRMCGRDVYTPQTPERVHARCRLTNDPQPKPSLARRAFNFSLAAIAHAVRGAPTCNQQQIDARLAVCQTCPLFGGSICRHADCGCRISQRQMFVNKLAWADQSCPLGKWPAIR